MSNHRKAILAAQSEDSLPISVPAFRDRFMPFAEVRHMTSLCRTVIYEQIKGGEFPRPYKLGSRRVAWRLSEIEAWMDAQRVAA